MGAVFTWFIASDNERGVALEGWQLPTIPKRPPQRVEAVNPFTRETMTTWRYEGPPTPDASPAVNDPDYEEQPHFSSRLDLDAAANLIGVLTGRDPGQVSALLLHLQLSGPPDFEGSVHVVPPDLVEALASAPRGPDTARKWAALDPLRSPGGQVSPEVQAGYERWLTQITELASTAKASGRDMFVHWSV